MKTFKMVLAGIALASLPVTPALAWKLVEAAKEVTVAKSSLAVTPGQAWNRSVFRTIKKGETWTLDGISLNELYFVGGLASGETLYRDANKKDRPLPKFRSDMQLNEIPEFVESSLRVAYNTSAFTMTGVEPFRMGERDGVKFTFEYSVDGNALMRKGVVVGSVAGGQLYLISFIAPATHYFDRDRSAVEALMATAHF